MSIIFLFLRQVMLPLSEINQAIPKRGLIYEIGSGNGAISQYLGERSPFRQIVGLDTDSGKIRRARLYNQAKNVHFEFADALKYRYQTYAGVVLSDFLHHVNFLSQERILRYLARQLKKESVLVIKEIDQKDGIRMWLSRLWDLIFYPHDKIYYRSTIDWIQLLTKLGLTVSEKRSVQWFPGSTHLFICKKD